MVYMAFKTRIEYFFDLFVFVKEFCNHSCVFTMTFHSKFECL